MNWKEKIECWKTVVIFNFFIPKTFIIFKIMIGQKVEAEFEDGSKLILTVSEHFKDVPFVDGMSGKILKYNDIYHFVDKNLCTWWYKDLCTIINN